MKAQTPPSADAARAFIEGSSFIWHERFELVPGVHTPGAHDIHELWSLAGLPTDLNGKSLIDIGTTNGAAAFLAERYGAERVVAVDIYDPDWFGFDVLRDFLGSRAEFRRANIYALPHALDGETFDYVLFWGVLYHLRHPLLALDSLRVLLAEEGETSIETALYDGGDDPVLRFYRRDELSADPSNWFTPTMTTLHDWCLSSGLKPVRSQEWGAGQGKRGVVAAAKIAGDPEYMSISYETPLRVQAIGGAATLGRGTAAPPERPWTQEYVAQHRRFLGEALDDAELLERLGHGESLPAGFGVGLDERVVELPWLLAQGLEGRVLDAGSALNHEHILDRILPRVSDLHLVTLEPEQSAFTDRRISYVYADLRDLPYRADFFETVVSVSTLEHVGMDNRVYGVEPPRSRDPVAELRRAVEELRRVASRRLLVTVPYGRREDHGWFRQFNRDDVEVLAEAAAGRRVSIDLFLHTAEGWRRSDLGEAADAVYRDFAADPSPVEDRAAAARAVACLAIEL
jgi:SAM-dependent methyltransferase